MLNNLIESAAHGQEMRRRTSFLLCTFGVYALLVFIGGIASIYAYDARVDRQNLDFLTLTAPVPATDIQMISGHPKSNSSADGQRLHDVRRNPIDEVNRPENPPHSISTTPNQGKPIRPGMPVSIGPKDFDGGPIGLPNGLGNSAGVEGSGAGGKAAMGIRVEIGSTPPAFRRAKPAALPAKPTMVASVVLTGKAISLPKPLYPQIASIQHIHGNVEVQVVLDELGRVLAAHAVSGHPLLRRPAVEAAFRARFSPTFLGGQAVKVSGIINYNFTVD